MKIVLGVAESAFQTRLFHFFFSMIILLILSLYLSLPSTRYRNWPSTSWQSCCLNPTRQRMMPWNLKICPRLLSRMKWGWSCRDLLTQTQPWHPENAKLAARISSGRLSHPVSFINVVVHVWPLIPFLQTPSLFLNPPSAHKYPCIRNGRL